MKLLLIVTIFESKDILQLADTPNVFALHIERALCGSDVRLIGLCPKRIDIRPSSMKSTNRIKIASTESNELYETSPYQEGPSG